MNLARRRRISQKKRVPSFKTSPSGFCLRLSLTRRKRSGSGRQRSWWWTCGRVITTNNVIIVALFVVAKMEPADGVSEASGLVQQVVPSTTLGGAPAVKQGTVNMDFEALLMSKVKEL